MLAMNHCSARHLLGSGMPCIIHRCVQCCLETQMLLSPEDLRRIVGLGYELDDFAVQEEAGWSLKNVSGRCVFLGKEGCRIYPNRPEGCHLYPLIYDETSGQAILDHLCPYTREFRVTKGDLTALKNLLVRLKN
jgi:Fe-S-cluster containining protein